jgi:Cd2+/Zn2+-exporting ATPase
VNAETGVGTSVAIAGAAGPLGWIRLADQPRGEAIGALDELKKLGVRTLMLTGDNQSTAKSVGASLGITEVRAELMPEEKAKILAELVSEFGMVGMVGDGVNDAPALASATVGISMGSIASAVTSQSADVVLMNDNLNSLPQLIRLSRKTLRVIRTNVIFALGSKFIVMILAAVGIAHFWLAMMADVGVSLIVVANALRLLRYEPKSLAKSKA